MVEEMGGGGKSGVWEAGLGFDFDREDVVV